jgi:polyisoprenoid-binding protein YceI
MLLRLTAAILAVVACGVACADPATFRVDPAHTSATFAVSQFGVALQHGRFDRTWGTIVLDGERQAGSIDLVIDADSVNTGWKLRDEFLRGENMFDTGRFPVLRFRATRFAFDDARLVGVDGEATLRGVTRPVRLAVSRFECSMSAADGREGCGASVTGHLSRRAFGMGFAYPLIGDDVLLEFALTAHRVRDERQGPAP